MNSPWLVQVNKYSAHNIYFRPAVFGRNYYFCSARFSVTGGSSTYTGRKFSEMDFSPLGGRKCEDLQSTMHNAGLFPNFQPGGRRYPDGVAENIPFVTGRRCIEKMIRLQQSRSVRSFQYCKSTHLRPIQISASQG